MAVKVPSPGFPFRSLEVPPNTSCLYYRLNYISEFSIVNIPPDYRHQLLFGYGLVLFDDLENCIYFRCYLGFAYGFEGIAHEVLYVLDCGDCFIHMSPLEYHFACGCSGSEYSYFHYVSRLAGVPAGKGFIRTDSCPGLVFVVSHVPIYPVCLTLI